MEYMNKMPLELFMIFSSETIDEAYEKAKNMKGDGILDKELLEDKYGNIKTMDDIIKIQEGIKEDDEKLLKNKLEKIKALKLKS